MSTLWKTAVTSTVPLRRSRRALAPLLGAVTLAGMVPWRDPRNAQAKKKKKHFCKCFPCNTCQKGKCTGVLPDGSTCGPGLVCQAGDCVPIV